MMEEMGGPIITPGGGDVKDDSWEQIVDCIKKCQPLTDFTHFQVAFHYPSQNLLLQLHAIKNDTITVSSILEALSNLFKTQAEFVIACVKLFHNKDRHGRTMVLDYA